MDVIKKILYIAVLLIPVVSPWTVTAAPPDDNAPSLLKTPSEACQSCHKAIHQQWQKSAHGQPRTLTPLYQALAQSASGCNNCHSPMAEDKEKFAEDGALPCVTCHTMESPKHDGKGMGIAAYQLNERVIQGPNGAWSGARGTVPPGSGDEELASNPFFHNANPETFRTALACLGCHDPKKKGDAKAYQVSCQSCHMPVSGGFADHGTPAGKSLRMVKRGVVLSLQAKKNDKDLDIQVTATNLLPHPFPNGGPFAMALLRLTLLDARGEPLWENVEKQKIDQDPKALFALTTADDMGHPAPPKAMTTHPPKDSRLKPGETRTLNYRMQQPLAATVRAEIIVLPLAPGWLEKLPEGKRELPKGLLAAKTEVKLIAPTASNP
ncbi:MAG: MULTIHEME CYTC protein [Magnetococcales bacterium]|nr:MULTIHEME CYTC protein [Magnetococcales bacterium]HIJ83828.1 hypothetical protein [Magnetococcales bacterium]